jgi:hypothetical protein
MGETGGWLQFGGHLSNVPVVCTAQFTRISVYMCYTPSRQEIAISLKPVVGGGCRDGHNFHNLLTHVTATKVQQVHESFLSFLNIFVI